MKSFKSYVSEENSGGFIAVKPTINQAELIKSICDSIGLEDTIDPNDLHVTIFYDRSERIFKTYEPKVDSYKAYITGCDLYNDALVLTLKSDKLFERYNELKLLGFHSDYAEYKPHISIKYGANEDNLAYLKNNFGMFKLMNSVDLSDEYSEKIQC
jgi:2'-5' RNA ligase